MRFRYRLRPLVAAAAAASAAGSLCGCGSGVLRPSAGDPIALSQFRSLQLGEPRAQVVHRLGAPESRRRVVPLGFIHEEPRGQRCIYYRRRFPDAGDRWSSSDTFQLCFRGSRLRHKWAYIAARA
jgi:hypothetical protein